MSLLLSPHHRPTWASSLWHVPFVGAANVTAAPGRRRHHSLHQFHDDTDVRHHHHHHAHHHLHHLPADIFLLPPPATASLAAVDPLDAKAANAPDADALPPPPAAATTTTTIDRPDVCDPSSSLSCYILPACDTPTTDPTSTCTASCPTSPILHLHHSQQPQHHQHHHHPHHAYHLAHPHVPSLHPLHPLPPLPALSTSTALVHTSASSTDLAHVSFDLSSPMSPSAHDAHELMHSGGGGDGGGPRDDETCDANAGQTDKVGPVADAADVAASAALATATAKSVDGSTAPQYVSPTPVALNTTEPPSTCQSTCSTPCRSMLLGSTRPYSCSVAASSSSSSSSSSSTVHSHPPSSLFSPTMLASPIIRNAPSMRPSIVVAAAAAAAGVTASSISSTSGKLASGFSSFPFVGAEKSCVCDANVTAVAPPRSAAATASLRRLNSAYSAAVAQIAVASATALLSSPAYATAQRDLNRLRDVNAAFSSLASHTLAMRTVPLLASPYPAPQQPQPHSPNVNASRRHQLVALNQRYAMAREHIMSGAVGSSPAARAAPLLLAQPAAPSPAHAARFALQRVNTAYATARTQLLNDSAEFVAASSQGSAAWLHRVPVRKPSTPLPMPLKSSAGVAKNNVALTNASVPAAAALDRLRLANGAYENVARSVNRGGVPLVVVREENVSSQALLSRSRLSEVNRSYARVHAAVVREDASNAAVPLSVTPSSLSSPTHTLANLNSKYAEARALSFSSTAKMVALPSSSPSSSVSVLSSKRRLASLNAAFVHAREAVFAPDSFPVELVVVAAAASSASSSSSTSPSLALAPPPFDKSPVKPMEDSSATLYRMLVHSSGAQWVCRARRALSSADACEADHVVGSWL